MTESSILSKRYRLILVSDLDWTMVDHDDKEHAALKTFNELWKSKFAEDSLLVFSTGRSHHLYEELRKEAPMLVPDVLVCSVGTEIFFESTGEPDKEWQKELDRGWDRAGAISAVEAISELKPQAASEQRPHKLSYSLSAKGDEAKQILARLEDALNSKGITAKVIYSGGEDVDILAAGASKGKGLEFLLRQLARGLPRTAANGNLKRPVGMHVLTLLHTQESQIEKHGGMPTDGVLVNGDSGNDVELFAVPGVRGTMVANAHPELREWCEAHASENIFPATKRCAGGIVEAIHHFGLA